MHVTGYKKRTAVQNRITGPPPYTHTQTARKKAKVIKCELICCLLNGKPIFWGQSKRQGRLTGAGEHLQEAKLKEFKNRADFPSGRGKIIKTELLKRMSRHKLQGTGSAVEKRRQRSGRKWQEKKTPNRNKLATAATASPVKTLQRKGLGKRMFPLALQHFCNVSPVMFLCGFYTASYICG